MIKRVLAPPPTGVAASSVAGLPIVTSGLGATTSVGQWPDNPIICVPHTYAVTGLVTVPSGATGYLPGFFVPVPTGQVCALVAVRYKIRTASDSVTFSIEQNGTGLTGLTGLSATNTATTTVLATATEILDDDEFAVVVTAIGTAPDGLAVTFYMNYQL